MLEELREKLRRTQQDKDVEDKKGTQPKKYYAKDADGDEMSKSTKDKRAAHFAKGGSTEPAPGDKGAKTKPSQHTKKFAKMYGEDMDESLWDNIRAKRARGEKMRPKGAKGAPTDDQIKRAKGESVEEKVDVKKALSKVKGLTKKQMEVLSTMNTTQLSIIVNQLSTLVMGEELEEGKLVAPVHSVIKHVTDRVNKRISDLYSKRPSDGVSMMNQVAKMFGMTVSDKGQKKGMLFLRMGDSLQENATVDAAVLKAKHAEELESLKANQEQELEALKDRHEREMQRADLAKEKETEDERIKKEREAQRKQAEKERDSQQEERDYKKEYANYHSKPEQIKRRAKRNEARRSLKDRKDIKGKDVHHKDNNPMNNDKSNLSIVSQKYNRSEPRLREMIQRWRREDGK